MMKLVRSLDHAVYWLIVLLPFSMAIAPAPMNVFMGLLIASFILKKILRRESLFFSSGINIPLLFLFIVTSLSIFYSVNLKDTVVGGILRLLQYIFIFFILAQELKDKRHIRNIIFAAALGVTLSSVDSIWQVSSGKDFIRGYAPIINIGLIRATASFKDSNTLGIYLSAITPLILGVTIYCLKGIKKSIFIIISLISVIGVALTYSRPTLLAVYLAMLLLIWVRRSKFLIALLLMFTLVSPFIVPKSVKDFAKQVNYDPIRFMCNDDRIAIFRNSFNMIKNHPVRGVGANTFMKNYKKYKESPEYMNIVTSDTLYAHNNFLHIAGELGLIGLSIFIWLLYLLFRECVNIYRHLDDDFLKVVSLSLSVCLLAFLVNGLTESSLYSSRVAIIFWYLMGFSLALKKFIYADKSARN